MERLFLNNQQPRRKRRGIKPSARIKYRMMHIFGTELRWYAARTGINANGFFSFVVC